jgi:hypothetical protein
MTEKEINQMTMALRIAFAGSASVGLLALALGDYKTALYGIFIAVAAIAGNKQLIKVK